MKVEDCRIETYTNSSRTISMKIVHEESGIFVEGKTERSSLQLRNKLMDELSEKITNGDIK